jgi:hypothetical protein
VCVIRHAKAVTCVTFFGLRAALTVHLEDRTTYDLGTWMVAVDSPGTDPLELVDRLFPAVLLRPLRLGDECTLDGDPRPHRIAGIHGDTAVVYLAALPNVARRRVRLHDCIPYPDTEAS